MNEGLSAADIMAMTRDGGNEMWNNPFIYLVWLAVLGGGGLGFGGRDSATQGAITRSPTNHSIVKSSPGLCRSSICVSSVQSASL